MERLFSLEGRKAIVIGGSRGIGKGLAEGLMSFGAEVVLVASSKKVLEVCAACREKGYKVHAVQADLASREERARAFAQCVTLLDEKLDVLVNAAGIQRRFPAENFPAEEWDRVLELNLTAVFELSQLAVAVMKKANYGKIINIGSLTSFRSNNLNVAAYQSTKGAIRQLTRAFAHEWSRYGIRSNVIVPGYIMTEMTAAVKNDPERYERSLAGIPLGHWGTPEDLVGAAILLASSAGDYINGTTLVVDGGYLAIGS